MRLEYSPQFSSPCIVIEAGDTADDVIMQADINEALYNGGEEEYIVVDFQTDPTRIVGPELYTRDALRLSMKPKALTRRNPETHVANPIGGSMPNRPEVVHPDMVINNHAEQFMDAVHAQMEKRPPNPSFREHLEVFAKIVEVMIQTQPGIGFEAWRPALGSIPAGFRWQEAEDRLRRYWETFYS